MKKFLPKNILVILFSIIGPTTVAQQMIPEKGGTYLGAGLNVGVVTGDFEELYSGNLGVDLFYFHALFDRFLIGASTGFAHYFSEGTIEANGTSESVDDLQFIPLTASMRFSPFKSFVGGGDIGYAFGVNSGNQGGLYLSPRATYVLKGKIPIFLGYRTIALESGNLNSFLFGVGYIF